MNRVSLVTGGAGGIGRAIVKNLFSRGDKVIVFDCLSEEDSVAQDFKKQGIQYFCVDISSVDSIISGFLRFFSSNPYLDILINNAGIASDNLAVRLKENDWNKVLDVNLKGLFFCTQQAIKHMLKNKKGYIVNISSIVGQRGNPGQANYAASKGGIISLTKTLAVEYGNKNILVNAIAPGLIETRLTKSLSDEVKNKALERIALRRFGTVDDVAKLVNFLTSGDADYITGAVLNIDGGMN